MMMMMMMMMMKHVFVLFFFFFFSNVVVVFYGISCKSLYTYTGLHVQHPSIVLNTPVQST